MGSVRIGAGYDIHSKFAATCYQLSETISVTKEFAPVVEGHFGWVIGYATARRKAGRIGMSAFEVIEPELMVVLSWIIFDERQLCPTHRPVVPPGLGRLESLGMPSKTRSR